MRSNNNNRYLSKIKFRFSKNQIKNSLSQIRNKYIMNTLKSILEETTKCKKKRKLNRKLNQINYKNNNNSLRA